MDTANEIAGRPAGARWIVLAVNTGAAIAAIQALFVLFTIIQGLSLRERADNFPGDLLHRVGIAFSTSVNIPSGVALLLAIFLVSSPLLVPAAAHSVRRLRVATLITVEAVSAVIAAGTIIGVRASLHAARVRTNRVSPFQRWELVAYLTGTLGTALIAFLVALAAMPRREPHS